MKKTNDIKQSVFGKASLIIGILNICVIIFFINRLSMWLITNVESMNNPQLIEGMKLPEEIIIEINILVALTIVGLLSGIIGFVDKKKRLFAIIGIVLNGSILLFCGLKYTL